MLSHLRNPRSVPAFFEAGADLLRASSAKAGIVLICFLIPGCASPPDRAAPENDARPAAQSPVPETAGLRGNVLLIIADDVGLDKISAYGLGDEGKRPRTPNIDRLAAEGVRFNNAFTYPVCSPTRASIATGRHCFRTGIGHAIRPKGRHEVGLALEEVTLPELLDLAGAGYDHSMVGKWHLSVPKVGGPRHPLLQGFAWAAGSEGNVQDFFDWPKIVNGRHVGSKVYSTIDLTDDAIARTNQMRTPWLLWLGYHAAHMPFQIPPPELHDRNPDRGDPTAIHVAMVEAMDREIGRLLASIEPEILEKTAIIFVGDNGTDRAVTSLGAGEPAKGSLHDAGIHVPLIVAGAAVPLQSRGRTCDGLVQAIDIFATIADLADVEPRRWLPEGRALDSVSFLPLLRDPAAASNRRYAYVDKFKPNGPGPYSEYDQAILDDRWKLVREHDWVRGTHQDEFYNRRSEVNGVDGPNLCPCPDKLTGEAADAYARLARELDAIHKP